MEGVKQCISVRVESGVIREMRDDCVRDLSPLVVREENSVLKEERKNGG